MASPELWSQLATAALLGSERANAWPELGGPLGAMMQIRQSGNREDLLLATAAAWDVYHRAGMLPGSTKATITVALPEDVARMTRGADEHLARLLAGDHDGVLPEWLQQCAHAGKRVWERHLPALLELATREVALRATILKIVGQRGVWLAAQNPDWRELSAADDESKMWETGTLAQRLASLGRVRCREPAVARQMIEQVWAQEAPDTRAALLQVLANGLSMADEPFLETALDDKRKEVRTIAVDLLARLPESRLTLRMMERVRELVRIETSTRAKIIKSIVGRGQVKLVVTLPEGKTKDLERDGVTGKSAVSGLGENAWVLAQMIGMVPLDLWIAGSDLTPAEMVGLAVTHEFGGALWVGWTLAAKRQHAVDWAGALIQYWLRSMNDPKCLPITGGTLIMDLLAALPPEGRETITIDALNMDWEKLDENVHLAMILACQHPWSAAFSRHVLTALRRHLARSKDVYQYTVRQVMERECARRLNPQIATEATGGWPVDAPESIQHAIETLISTLQFRHDMHKEFLT